MDSYETLSKNLDKDVEYLEQLIAYCNIWENQTLYLLKDLQDIMNLLKNLEDELERRVAGMRRWKGSDIPSSFRLENQVRLIKTIGEMEKALKALDPNNLGMLDKRPTESWLRWVSGQKPPLGASCGTSNEIPEGPKFPKRQI